MTDFKSDVRDGMRIDWDVPIPMGDGVVLRADVFRPIEEGRYPVILTYGPYAKGLSFQDGYPSAWQRLVAEHPDVAAGSSNLYQSWEVVDQRVREDVVAELAAVSLQFLVREGLGAAHRVSVHAALRAAQAQSVLH